MLAVCVINEYLFQQFLHISQTAFSIAPKCHIRSLKDYSERYGLNYVVCSVMIMLMIDSDLN